ncbi:hypothetical protein C5B42_00760 [Candidatus Cerribacteria bacterium 'Amazon FNV 2010 28 9']|uniref:Uncharacterized protein n=1 Tax=Candidatus Cerribacteria bacterium 'Amazon FNV 2010 28 9' TaxID=2081795 RepID=A0A317JQW5_9BACT|nr:MAG: hypothetical protein C5B42_00760 [Candidatus Cerribacteria bacterium 'Amazon FNV 2010 28 9']
MITERVSLAKSPVVGNSITVLTYNQEDHLVRNENLGLRILVALEKLQAGDEVEVSVEQKTIIDVRVPKRRV